MLSSLFTCLIYSMIGAGLETTADEILGPAQPGYRYNDIRAVRQIAMLGQYPKDMAA